MVFWAVSVHAPKDGHALGFRTVCCFCLCVFVAYCAFVLDCAGETVVPDTQA